MEFSMKSFAVVSLLLLVSLSTDMSGPLLVDAEICNRDLCGKYCALQGKFGCCPGINRPCRCSLSTACPFMNDPLEVDTGVCNWNLCQKYCALQGKPGCCPGINRPCRCTTGPCPRFETKEITEEIMVDTTDEELIIKETVTA